MDAGQSPLADRVYVERLTEPYSGMLLIGVGGFVHSADCVEVRYDCETAVVLTPTAHADGLLHFATQLPLESNVTTLSVVAKTGYNTRSLYQGAIARIGERPTDTESNAGSLGMFGRGVRSVITGEVFSPARWAARFDRLQSFLLRARQKVRYKLLARRHRPRSTHDAYLANSRIDRDALRAAAASFRYRPTISILLPVYNVEPRWLDAAIQSVREQVYDRWELCLADDASTNPALLRYLGKLPNDPRIKIVRRPVNGHISAASNSTADLATGEFIALLDNDDAIAPDALFEIASLLQMHPDADLIYSDEDKIDADGRRYDPQIKPRWSPELLLSYNYINHFTCIRRRVFEQAGRFRVGYEGSQDHDLLLRVTERTDRIHHIPKLLYHWRALPTSTATAAGVKTYVHTSGRMAVEDALARRGIVGALAVPAFAERLGIPILELVGTETSNTAVIVYGPATDAAATVRTVAGPGVTTYLVLDPPNLADALNRLAASRTETHLVYLRAGVVPTDADWLRKLTVHLDRPEIGAAGGLIRGPSGEIVSAGTVLGMRDGLAPGNAFHGLTQDAISYYFYAEVTRNVTAPAEGILATTRAAFESAGGFDAERYPRTTFDIDYCLRLAGLGLRCVHVGGVEFASESTADRADDPTELKALLAARGRLVDPYYNRNLCDYHSFRPLATPQMPAAPSGPLSAVVAAHNLNNPEGAPRYLSEIALGLARRKAIVPAVWSPTDGPGADVYRTAGIDVHVGAAKWRRRFIDGRWTPREYEDAQRHLTTYLRGQRPNVLIANTLLTFPVIEAAARVGIPAVWIIHESYSAEHLMRLFPAFARHRIELAFATASRVVPASHATAKLFERFDTRGNFRVLHNGLNAAPFERYIRRVSKAEAVERIGGTPGKKRIVCVGTVCERKGQHTLIEAAAKLAESRTDFACDIVGVRDDVPYAKYVRKLVYRRGLENVVRLIDETDDVWAYYRAADVYVCTSHMETFSRSMLEAEAFGLPVVSTDCCGVSEQVFWGFNALSFDAGDANGLAGQLELVLADDNRRAAMASRSRAAFDLHLTETEMLDRYETVIRSAARGPSRSAEMPVVRRAA